MPSPADDWIQPANGYRFTEDSVMLARFCPGNVRGTAADLGAGCGVVLLEAMVQGRLKGVERAFLVERDPAFLPALEANAERARALAPGLPPVKALIADWRGLSPGDLDGPAAFVCSNPPYFRLGTARPPASFGNLAPAAGAAPPPAPPGAAADPERAGADGRWELHGGIASLAEAASRILAPGGLFSLCFPGPRFTELLLAASGAGFVPEIARFSASRSVPLALAYLRKPPSGP
ncbi:MAG: hypothetical protein LBQ12_06840 [Deltaproteobacteria bacterium]|jgi:tRNA1Val (adenine37-N6)-methyltransferase|nr:hypothetical protein [Deltaproteobacteria bacterium]